MQFYRLLLRHHILTNIGLAVLAIFASCCIICQVDARLLVGGVQQSNTLAAITPELSDDIARKASQPQVNWFAIPHWMAGQWTKEGDVTISMTDLRSGIVFSGKSWTANRMTRQFGHQLDSGGDVWWALLMPAEQEGESKRESVEFLVLSLKVERSTPSELVTRTRYLVSESSEWGVYKQYQQEALNHYFFIDSNGEGTIENRSYNRVFDLSGRPQRDAVLISQWHKTGPFLPMQSLQGVNLPRSLNYYLRTHNLNNLATTNSFFSDSRP